jgi:hypothetical protein
MKSPDSPNRFEQTIREIPPDDLPQTLGETFDEMHADAQTGPTVLMFPPAVIESVESFTKGYLLDPDSLISLALETYTAQIDLVVEGACRLIQDPVSFAWPVEKPLLCVAIAFMRVFVNRWTDKVHEKPGLTEDRGKDDEKGDPADWWKRL